MTCETCQAQLLHHLYGVLDESDRRIVTAHLATCATCQAALEAARQQQRMLAVAAKGEFPNVRFVPIAQAAQLATTVELPRKKRSPSWLRWAVAACILVLLGGAATFAGVAWQSYTSEASRAREELARIERDKANLRETMKTEEQRIADQIQAIQNQIKQLETQFQSDLGTVQRDFENQQIELSVTHPKTLQAGGVNKLLVKADRKPGAPPKAAYFLIAQIINDKTKALVSQTPLKEGVNELALPASLPVQEGDQLTLRVLALGGPTPPGIAGAVGSAAAPVLLAAQPGQTLFQESLPLVTSIYVTHLMTDRPLYRPGEVVYFRSLTLARSNLKPPTQDFHLSFKLVRLMAGKEQVIEVLDPETGQPAKLGGLSTLQANGKAVPGPDGNPIRGVGAGAFQLPEDLPGGEYSLVVSEAEDRFPTEKRKIIVNRYQAPRLYKDVDFTRKSYGPGDMVTALCKVAAVEGGKALAGQEVKVVTAEVDGKPCKLLSKVPLHTDERGECVVQFRLPAVIDKGEGVLAVQFTDGANVETQVEPIPIVLKKLKVDFFPEGGELVAGIKNRVYFQARTTLNKPAELSGRVVDQDGNEVAAIQTLADDKEIGVNQGMGRFDFVPQAGKIYELKIDAPQGIEGRHRLPPVQDDGVVLHLPYGVVTHQIDVVLTSAKKERKLLVGAYCRGKLLDHQTVIAPAGQPVEFALKPDSSVGGVYRVTVFEINDDKGLSLTPLAERLLYRRSPEKLNLKVFCKGQYTPGDKVTLSLTATNEHNQPAPAIVVVSVVDKSILKLRNDRTARSMPAHFLLTSEVRGPEDLEYADFLLLEQPRTALGFEVAKASVALDLLLGTQGWRRFIEQELPGKRLEAQKFFKEDVQRLDMVSGQTKQEVAVDKLVAKQKVARFVGPAVAQHEKLEVKLRDAEEKEDKHNAAQNTELVRAEVAVARQRDMANRAEMDAKEFGNTLLRVTVWLLAVGVALTSMVLIVIGLARSNQGKKNGLSFLVAGLFMFIGLLTTGVTWLAVQVAENQPFASSEQAARNQRLAAGAQAKVAQEKNWVGGGMAPPGTAAAAPPPGALDGGPKEPNRNKDQGKVEGVQHKGKFANAPQADAGVARVEAPAKADEAKQVAMVKKFVPEDRLAMKVPPMAPDQAVAGQIVPGIHEPAALAANMERALRKQGKVVEVTQKRLLGLQQQTLPQIPASVKLLAKIEPMLVREYAHKHTPNTDGVRRDFAETLCWHPVLVLPGDKATDISFDLSDAVTRFEVQVWGHTLDGKLGALTKDITSTLPFHVDVKLPTEISNTDTVKVPVAVANNTEKNLNVKLKIEADKLKLAGSAEPVIPAIKADSKVRQVLEFRPDTTLGTATLKLSATCDPFFVDAVERQFKIVPEGFPVVGKLSDTLKGTVEHRIQLPKKRELWVPGTLKLQVQVFPSTLADLQKGLEALLREPCGCFEQTSSSNYPNVMILDYLKESDQAQPQIEKKARALMDRGYGKLVSFECIDPATKTKKQGYEWFGQTAPPHEALTAYGLLQFTDMAKYQPVDQAMVERTKKYLLSKRNAQGGFDRNQRALDTFGRAPDHITDAYIVWALLESGVKEDLGPQLDALQRRIDKDAQAQKDDPYFIALVSLSLQHAGRKDAALKLLQKLQMLQQADGKLMGTTTSITHSGGSQLAIETTSLAVLTWLRAQPAQQFSDNANKAVKWIGGQRGGYGGYGSTQSTILALKALIAHTKANKQTASAGKVLLFVNDREQPVAVTDFPAGTVDPIVVELPDENLLQPDVNTIRVQLTGDRNEFPHTLTWTYNALSLPNSKDCPVHLSARLSTAKAVEGDTVRLTAVLQNASKQEQGMAVAILGLPAGLQPPTDLQELRNLVAAGKIDAFEIKGRELVLYWRGLAKDAELEVNINLVCQIPGTYRGPASRAYLYYNADERWWVEEPLAIDILPKQ
jgi:hypothetical protein